MTAVPVLIFRNTGLPVLASHALEVPENCLSDIAFFWRRKIYLWYLKFGVLYVRRWHIHDVLNSWILVVSRKHSLEAG